MDPTEPSASEPIDLRDWGRKVLRPARERAVMTRAQLALRSGIAESTIRNIETARHQPRRQTLQSLCAALALVDPLASPERLSLPLAGVSRDRALALIAEALADFVRARSDARAFAERLCPRPGIEQFQTQIQAADDYEHGAALHAALVAEKGSR
jgi:transcriptional regulator with XRE-family HTH domain